LNNMSNNNNNNSNNNSIGFTSLLTVAFIVLKLCNVIDWTWFWVLSPLWISFGLGLILVIIAVIIKTTTEG
jgi:ABC-type nickel/cobalt efflux system permease component RcnA